MTLSTTSNFIDPDTAYRLVVEAHRGLRDEDSALVVFEVATGRELHRVALSTSVGRILIGATGALLAYTEKVMVLCAKPVKLAWGCEQ